MTKNFTYMTNNLCKIGILLLNILNIFKTPGFIIKISSFSEVLFKSFQTLGFSRFFMPKFQIPGFFDVFQGYQVKWQPLKDQNYPESP